MFGPNITGNIFNFWYDGYNGAITLSNDNATFWLKPTSYEDKPEFKRLMLDASHSNAIYGASTTVQPNASAVQYLIKY